MASPALIDTIRDGFGRIAYTHKTHEKQIELLAASVTRYKWIHLVSLVLTTLGTLSVVITNVRWAEIATAGLAAVSLGITVYGWSFAPEQQILHHRLCARQLWHIRERYLNLITDMVAGTLSDDEAAKRRDSLVDQIAVIYQHAPDTTSRAYMRARAALKAAEELTFSDEEIDDFLPTSLRKKGDRPTSPAS